MFDTIIKIVNFVLSAFSKDVTLGIWPLFSKLFLNPLAMFDDADVQTVQVFMTTLALGLLPMLVTIQAMRLSARRWMGYNDTPPELLAQRTMTAGIATLSVSTLVWVLINFGNGIIESFASGGLDMSLLRVLFSPGAGMGIGLLVLVIILAIGAVILTFQKAIVSGELAFMLGVGPVAGLSLLYSDEGGFWGTWVRETASLILTPVVHILLTWLFLRKVAKMGDLAMSWEARMLAFGYLYIIWRTPAWLRQFAYSFGHGSLLVQGGASVARATVMRRMLAATAKTVVRGGAPA